MRGTGNKGRKAGKEFGDLRAIATMGNGVITVNKVLGSIDTQIAFIKVISKTSSNTARENNSSPQETSTRANISKASQAGSASTSGRTGTDTRVSSSTDFATAKG